MEIFYPFFHFTFHNVHINGNVGLDNLIRPSKSLLNWVLILYKNNNSNSIQLLNLKNEEMKEKSTTFPPVFSNQIPTLIQLIQRT
jgi:hypothetical protein